MDDRSRAHLAIGLVLLSVPIWAPLLDLTGHDYVYDHTPIEIHDGEIEVEPRAGAPAPKGDIACFGVYEVRQERLCYFERALLADNVTVGAESATAGGERPGGPPYVVFGSTGSVYERTFENSEDGGYELGLRRADPEVALEQVARDADNWPQLRRVVENDGIRTDEPIIGYQSTVVHVDGNYHLVYEDGTRQFLSAKPGVERGIEALLMAIGAYLLFSAGRRGDQRSE